MTTSSAGRSGTFYYHTNNLYNVRALTDASGGIVERYRYSAYGEPTILDDASNERPRSAVGNPYMFQGRRYEEETGLYYYRNRYYSAQLGRFVTRDPVGYVDGYNLYEYGSGAPLCFTDPYGGKVGRRKSWSNSVPSILCCILKIGGADAVFLPNTRLRIYKPKMFWICC